jgi:hypothetical protein
MVPHAAYAMMTPHFLEKCGAVSFSVENQHESAQARIFF